jgi:hypothetical protein
MANKLRTRSLNEGTAKQVITEGLLAIFITEEASLQIELKLLAYLQGRPSERGLPPATRP